MRLTKTRCTISRRKRCVKTTPISVEEYLGNEISKTNKIQTGNKLNELLDHLILLHNDEYFNEMEMAGKDTVPGTIQQPKHMNAEHTRAIRQYGDRTKDKWEHNMQLCTQENYMMMTWWQISRKLERPCYTQDTLTLIKLKWLHQQDNRDCVISWAQPHLSNGCVYINISCNPSSF